MELNNAGCNVLWSSEAEHLTSCRVLYVLQWTRSSLGRGDSMGYSWLVGWLVFNGTFSTSRLYGLYRVIGV